jgi:phosphoribosylanthranilate isomerase
MFQVKVCGVTTPGDADRAVALGADAVGVNFYRDSRRRVDEGTAREIVAAVGNRAEVVAVFVNESPDAIASLCARLGITRVQLHGDESPEDAARLALWRMKAVHAGGKADLRPLRGYPCEAYLVDAGAPGEYGGTGRSLDWPSLRDRIGILLERSGGKAPGRPWVLAGGLTPGNVERAIALARPDAVDVASGVESAPGRKDPVKVAAFVERAKRGLLLAGA